jgi:hypothetical protein
MKYNSRKLKTEKNLKYIIMLIVTDLGILEVLVIKILK